MTFSADAALWAARAGGDELDPKTVYGIGASGLNGEDAIDAAEAAAAFQATTRHVNALYGQSIENQRKQWNALDQTTRSAYTAAGYRPPKTYRGALGWVQRGLGELSNAGELAARAFGAPLGGVLHNWRIVGTYGTERKAQLDREFASGKPLGEVLDRAYTFDAKRWARIRKDTRDGEKYFRPTEVADVRRRYGDDVTDWAKQLASGTTPDQIIANVAEDERDDLYARLTDPAGSVAAATMQMEAAKFSAGRALLPSHMAVTHPELHEKITGAGDALFDIIADPTFKGAKVFKDWRNLRFIVRDADDVKKLAAHPSVRRHMDVAGSFLERGDRAGLIEFDPRYANISTTLVNEGVDSATKLQAWYEGQAGLDAILTGRASGFTAPTSLMPRLTPTGFAAAQAKGAMKKVIDYTADAPWRFTATAVGQVERQAPGLLRHPLGRIEFAVGNAARRLSVLQHVEKIDPLADEAAVHIQRFAYAYLPRARAHDLVNAWTGAGPELGAKLDIFKGLLDETFNSAGVKLTPEGRAWAKRYIGGLDEAADSRIYSAVQDADKMLIDGKTLPVGFKESDLTPNWSLPSLRDLATQAKRIGVARALYGAMDARIVDAYMSSAFKPMALLKPSFGFRTSIDELVLAAMREGPKALAKGALARSSESESLSFLSRTPAWLWSHLTPASLRQITNPVELAAQYVGNATHRAFRRVAGKLAGDEYVAGARELAELYGDWFLPNQISAVTQRAAGYMSDVASVSRSVRRNSVMHTIGFKPSGDYRHYQAGHEHFVEVWANDLEEVAGSTLGRRVVAVADQSHDDAVRRIADYIESPEFASQRKRALRAIYLRDGRRVGVDATAREAAEDWADVYLQHVNALIREPDGTVITELLTGLRSTPVKVPPGIDVLEKIAPERRPMSVKGPETIPVVRSWIGSVVDHAFEEVAGRPVDWLARQPLYVHNYVLAKKEVAALAKGLSGGEADAIIREAAADRALRKTIPFIDNPAVRSQFEVFGRNLLPFMFAQQQFLKRTVQTFVHSPEALRELQLAHMGLRASHIIQVDDQGTEYVHLPVLGDVQLSLTKLLTRFGYPSFLPVKTGAHGAVKFIAPSLNPLDLPSFGPLISVPVAALARLMPELSEEERALLGGRGADRPFLQQVVPGTLGKLVTLAFDDPDRNAQMLAQQANAIKLLEATGHGLADNASPGEAETWFTRVRNWSRVLYFTRMLYGFLGPVQPGVDFDPDDLSPEYRKLLQTFPQEEALRIFVKAHPDATPFTVFNSRTAGGPLPATENALNFMRSHEALLREHLAAAGWLIPASDATGTFSQEAYHEQVDMQLRAMRSPKEMVEAIKVAKVATTYFDAQAQRDKALEGKRGNAAANIRHQWSVWSKDLLARNPIFADWLLSSSGRRRRIETRRDVAEALTSDALQGEQYDAMRAVVKSYANYELILARWSGYNSGTAQNARRRAKLAFQAWADTHVVNTPSIASFYNSVYRPEVDIDE